MLELVTKYTFLTDYIKDGKIYAGKNIEANSWEEANIIAKRNGTYVIGIFVQEVPVTDDFIEEQKLINESENVERLWKL